MNKIVTQYKCGAVIIIILEMYTSTFNSVVDIASKSFSKNR